MQRKEKKGRWMNRCELTELAVLVLTQYLHCLFVCALSFSSSPPLLTFFHHSFVLLFLFFFFYLLCLCATSCPFFFAFFSLFLSAASEKPQSLDAAVFHLIPAHCQLLCAQHVCGRGGGKLSQVSPAAGGGRGAAEGGETTEATGEEEEK